jgi:RNA polymerase sigma-70 factor, ECF subfamily
VVTVRGDQAEAYVSRSADEEAASFDTFFRSSSRQLVAMAYLLTGDLQTAQDLTQEAFLRAWSRWARISKYDDPQAWIRRVLYNLAVSKSRSNRLRRNANDVPRSIPPPDESHLMLAAALRSLPRNQTRALLLHDGAGMSVHEVANEMNVPDGTVKSWLSRGRSAAALILTSSTSPSKEGHAD